MRIILVRGTGTSEGSFPLAPDSLSVSGTGSRVSSFPISVLSSLSRRLTSLVTSCPTRPSPDPRSVALSDRGETGRVKRESTQPIVIGPMAPMVMEDLGPLKAVTLLTPRKVGVYVRDAADALFVTVELPRKGQDRCLGGFTQVWSETMERGWEEVQVNKGGKKGPFILRDFGFKEDLDICLHTELQGVSMTLH